MPAPSKSQNDPQHPPGRTRSRGMAAAFGAAIVLLLSASILSNRSMQRLLEAARWSHHTQAVIAQVREVQVRLTDAETGGRGFALTGDEHFLEPHDRARDSLPQQLARLRSFTEDDPRQQRRLDTLNALIEERLREVAGIIQTRRSEGLEAVSHRVGLLRGKQLMDEARSVLAEMEAAETQLQLERDRRVEADARLLNRTLLGLSAVALGVIGLAFAALNRENARRALAEEALRRLNAHLEERVGERTAEVATAYQQRERDLDERTRLEQTLRDTELRLRATLDCMLEGCQIIGFDWRYLYLNEAAARQGRQPKEALIGRTMMEAYPGIESSDMFAALRRCMEQRVPHRMENQFTLPNEPPSWFQLSLEPVPEGVFILSMDITERRRAEEQRERALQELQRVRRELALILDSAGEGIYGIELGGNLTFVNPAAARMCGWEVQELRGQPAHALLHHSRPDGSPYPRGECPIYAAFKGGVTHRVDDEVFWRKDGTSFPVEYVSTALRDENGAVVGAVVTFNDISERKRAEQEVRKAQERYRLATEVAKVGVWDWDLTTDAIYVDPALKALLGFADHEIRNHMDAWAERGHPEDSEQVAAAAQAHLDGGTPRYEIEHRMLHKDGSVRHFLSRGTAIRETTGRPVRMVGSDMDVTERHSLEQQFRQAQKMEAVGQLAGGVAHDFNNLLGVIIGYSELLLGAMGPERPERKRVEQIRKAAERAAALTRQLLAFSRKQLLQPKVLDLNGVVADVEPMLRRLIGEHIQVVAQLAEGLRRVKVDPSQVEQVIVNLAVNARDAMPRGGTLVLETANVELDEAYVRNHAGAAPGPHVMLAVGDTGHGMDEPTLARIFEPFFTTKEPGKGTGLGLATVYGIVKQSGGSINVYSEPGRGTTFKVYLPAAEGKAEALWSPTAGAAPRGSETVLVVEDEAALREVIREVLEEAGYAVLDASGLEEALSSIRSDGATVRLLLTDVVLPGPGGREVAQRVRAAQPTIKVLYMSGYTDGAIAHHGVIDAGVHFINKPFSSEALLRKVREMLDAPEESL